MSVYCRRHRERWGVDHWNQWLALSQSFCGNFWVRGEICLPLCVSSSWLQALLLQLQQPPLRLPDCELLGPRVSCPYPDSRKRCIPSCLQTGNHATDFAICPICSLDKKNPLLDSQWHLLKNLWRMTIMALTQEPLKAPWQSSLPFDMFPIHCSISHLSGPWRCTHSVRFLVRALALVLHHCALPTYFDKGQLFEI